MMTADWRNARIGSETTIRSSLDVMGRSRLHILFVVDGDDRLLGTVTDGDIRRALLRSISLEEPVLAIMKREPITFPAGGAREQAKLIMLQHDIQHLPVIDGNGRIIDLYRIGDFVLPPPERPNWVVLLAGGRGQRLLPKTEHVPKPLLPVGNRPILETILTELAANGFRKFYLSVNYKAEMVKEHFGDGSRFGVEVRYIEEQEPLGTAGCLSLIQERHDAPLLVMNGDLLTKVGFDSLLAFHRGTTADMTVCVRSFDFQVPFGVVKLDDNRIQDIIEKPVQSVMVSAGIYVIDPALPASLPQQRIDMPDLMRLEISAGRKVIAFPIHEYWIDVGRMTDLSRADAEYDSHFA